MWRQDPDEPLQDYRMTRVTFGVPASSFAANISVKQNVLDHALDYPLAADAVHKSFFMLMMVWPGPIPQTKQLSYSDNSKICFPKGISIT